MATKIKPLDRRKVLEFDDADISKLMEEDWLESDEYFQDHFRDFRRFDKMYDRINPVPEPTTREQGGFVLSKNKRSRNFYPITTVIVDTLFAIINSTIFGFKDFFEIVPQQDWEIDQHKYAVKNWLIWELGPKRVGFRKTFETWLMQALKYRWSIARVGYQIAGKNVMSSSKMTAADILSEEPNDEVRATMEENGVSDKLYKKIAERIINDDVLGKIEMPAFTFKHDPTANERPTFDVFNTYYTRPDPHSTDFNDFCRFLGDEVIVPWTWILENTQSKDNPDALYEKGKVDQLGEWWYGQGDEPGYGSTTLGREDRAKIGRDMVILRRWRNQYGEFVSSLDWKIILRRSPKSDWDVAKLEFWPLENRFFASCVIERIEKLNLEINDVANSRRDNVHMSIDGITAVDAGKVTEEENPDLHLSYSGKVMKVNGPPKDFLHIFYPNDVTNAAREEIRFIMDIIERVVAVGEPAQGALAMSQRTATEHEQVAAGLATRMRPIIDRIEREDVSWAISAILAQDMLNMTAEKAFTVLGAEGLYIGQMSPEILSRYGPNIDVIPLGSTYEVNNYLSRVIVLETLSTMAKTPMNEHIDWLEAARVLIESSRLRGGSQLLKDDPTMRFSIPPEMENSLILKLGQQVVVSDRDDVPHHLQVHEEMMLSSDYRAMPEMNRLYFETHYAQTQEQMKRLQQVKPGPVNQAGMDFQGKNMGDMIKGFSPMARAPINEAGGMTP